MRDEILRKKQERDGNWYRYKLPLNIDGVEQVFSVFPRRLKSVTSDGQLLGGELVRINEDYKYRPYRYSYGFTGFAGHGVDGGGFEEWALVKMDASAHIADEGKGCNYSVKIWKRENCYPSEPIFVSRNEGDNSDEDDGVILSLVYDGERRESFLLVLDAREMTELARCYTDCRTCISFHGAFLPYKKN